MARGRMISNGITKDKRVHDLKDDTSRLAFTWLVTFADCEGRVDGDPAIVRAMLFPRRTDISIERMEFYISEWHSAGLIEWYEAEGDLWILFPNFDKHQVGLRKDREAPSAIPAPPVQTDSGETQELGGSKSPLSLSLSEVEGKGNGRGGPPSATYSTGDAHATRIYTDVTGYVVIPGKQADKQGVEQTILHLEAHHDGIVEYLQPFWDEWKKREYNPSNHAWLTEWAVTGSIPPKPAGKGNNSAEEIDTWLQP